MRALSSRSRCNLATCKMGGPQPSCGLAFLMDCCNKGRLTQPLRPGKPDDAYRAPRNHREINCTRDVTSRTDASCCAAPPSCWAPVQGWKPVWSFPMDRLKEVEAMLQKIPVGWTWA